MYNEQLISKLQLIQIVLSRGLMLTNLQSIITISDQNNLLHFTSPAYNEEDKYFGQNIESGINIDSSQYYNLIEQMQSHRTNLIAVEYYLKKQKKKALKSLENNVEINQYVRVMARYFENWKIAALGGKLQNKILKRRVFAQLAMNQDRQMRKNMMNVMRMTADNCYQRCLKMKMFQQWKLSHRVERKYITLMELRKKKQLKNILSCWEIRKNENLTKNLASSISNEKIVKACFYAWIITSKSQKCKELLFGKRAVQFIPKLRKHKKRQQTVYKKLYNKSIMKRSFEKIKANFLVSKYQKYHRRKLIKRYFFQWISAGSRLFYEKEKQINSQIALKEFLERKAKVKLLYYFQKWKKSVHEKMENRKKNQIAKQYGEVKQKQYLLRKYFVALSQHAKCCKFYRYYCNKLKWKVMNILKNEIIKSSERLDNVYRFVEKRQRKKYFDAIIAFNKQEKQKIYTHLITKYWNTFTLQIVKNYVSSNTKAQGYHEKILKYKAFFNLKNAVILKSKTNRAIVFVNVNLNLRRWRKYLRVTQFVEMKKAILLSQVFRELKLMRMNRIWSQPDIELSPAKNLRQFSYIQYRTPESQHLMQRINSDSPSKLFSLEYSISAYNSNNYHQI